MSVRKAVFLLTIMSPIAALNAAELDDIMADCDGCHGDKGVSQWSDVPTIAGMAEFVQADALFVFADGDRSCADSEYRQGDTARPSTNMCDVASNLSEEQIEAVAAAYAAFPYVKATQEFDAALAAAGETLHQQNCDRCHADAGTDPDDEAGMLGGQWMDYLRFAFAEYAAGERDQLPKMKEKMDLLSEADVEALIHYYGSQQ